MSNDIPMKIAAGGITAFMEVCIMHPLDLVKTCLQLHIQPRPTCSITIGVLQFYYMSMVNCVRSVYQRENIFSFWKGVLPPVLIETPRRAVNTYYAAGLCVGVTEAIVMTPFEQVKVTLMADRSPHGRVPSTWDVLKMIVTKQGVGFEGLNRGISATVISHGIFSMVFFGVFNTLKSRLQPISDELLYMFHIMGIGFSAGTLASIANNPFDVAKTRIQGPQPEPGVTKYRYPLATVATVYREERLFGLFKGLVPRILRRGVGSALMVAGYDFTYRYLTDNFPD